MRRLLIPALLLAALPAQAKIVAFLQTTQGRVELHDEAGQCVGVAKRADFVYSDGTRVGGCWLMGSGVVQVVFLDGDTGQIPAGEFQTPKAA